jgi:signal transduction histidine kinase
VFKQTPRTDSLFTKFEPLDDQKIKEFFEQLKSYVDWSDLDSQRVTSAWPVVERHLDEMIDDFYESIQRHDFTNKIITGGEPQVQRLKKTLREWLRSLFAGPYDIDFAISRWNVGQRHVAIGLHQGYAIAALGRLRSTMNRVLLSCDVLPGTEIVQAIIAINKLLDMDSALIDLAYEHSVAKQLAQSAKEKVEQAERLAAIGQMVTGLAHESRNLLQRSHACLETLILDVQDRPDVMKQANRIEGCLDRLLSLYEEVRNYAAPIKLDFERFDLHQLLINVWQNLEPRRRECQVHCECVHRIKRPCLVWADRNRIDQVLTNLLQNAIDACGQNGLIRCTLDWNEDLTSCIMLIEDSGVGIKLPEKERIFVPFFTTKAKGTGLGLAITKRIVDAHSGELEVSDSKLGGAKFTLTIPANQLA